jgi:hypothetical protein
MLKRDECFFAIFCEATYTLVYVSIVQTPYPNLYHGLLHCLIDLLERDGVATKQQMYIGSQIGMLCKDE